MQGLREESDLLMRKQKEQEEKLGALSKTIIELDARRQSLMVEAATKSEQLSRINDKTEESRKTLQKLGADISAFETVKENFNRLKKELEKTNADKEQIEKTIKDLEKQESIEADNADNLTKESEAIRAAIVALSQDKNNLLKEKDSLSKQIENFKTTSDLNKKTAEDSIFKAQSLKEDLDLLMRKQKEETDRLSAVSKTIIELDARKQSLMVEVATKSEQLAQINREKDYLRKIRRILRRHLI